MPTLWYIEKVEVERRRYDEAGGKSAGLYRRRSAPGSSPPHRRRRSSIRGRVPSLKSPTPRPRLQEEQEWHRENGIPTPIDRIRKTATLTKRCSGMERRKRSHGRKERKRRGDEGRMITGATNNGGDAEDGEEGGRGRR